MSNFQQWLGILAGILSFAAFVPYIRAIFLHQTRPCKATWIIWLIVGMLLFASHSASGARYTLWMPISYIVGPAIVVALSIKYGSSGWSCIEIVCLVLAACSLVVWKLTQSVATALVVHLIIDALGALPTLAKAYSKPSEENKLAWFMIFLASFLNLLAIDSTNWLCALYPVYMFVGNGLIFSCLIRPSNNIRL